MSDPTDPGGVGAAQAERLSRTTRVGDGGSPVGSPLTIVLSVIAVVVGFLIFRTIDSNGSAAELPGSEVTTPTAPAGSTVAPTPTTSPGATTTAAPTIDPNVRAVVINSGEVGGSAGDMTEKLEAVGFTMEPGVSDNDSDVADTTTVLFLEGTGNPSVEAVANLIAQELGGVTVSSTASAPAVSSGDSVGAATVFVLLGTDLAGKDLPGQTPSPPTPPPVAGPPTTPPA